MAMMPQPMHMLRRPLPTAMHTTLPTATRTLPRRRPLTPHPKPPAMPRLKLRMSMPSLQRLPRAPAAYRRRSRSLRSRLRLLLPMLTLARHRRQLPMRMVMVMPTATLTPLPQRITVRRA